MKKYSLELTVGVFVLIGLLCLGYVTVKLGKMEIFSDEGYAVTANFASITGLRVGASVEIAGVPVGKVNSITLTPSYAAKVGMLVNSNIELTDDAIASIKTSGIIGDKYVSISQGSGDVLEPGEEIFDTESAVDLEALISKYVCGDVK